MKWPLVTRRRYERDIDVVAGLNRVNLARAQVGEHQANQAWESIRRLVDSAQYWERRCQALQDPERAQPDAIAEHLASLSDEQQSQILARFAFITKQWPQPRCLQTHNALRKVPDENLVMVADLLRELHEYAESEVNERMENA